MFVQDFSFKTMGLQNKMKLFAISDKTNVITSAVGIFAFYAGLYWLLYVCAALSVIHSLLNMTYGGQNNLGSELLALVVGAVLALILHRPGVPYCAVALCYLDVLLMIPVLVAFFVALFGARKR